MALLAALWLFSASDSAAVRTGWQGVYDDAPVAFRIAASHARYRVGDTLRLSLTATNTSDRVVLLRRNWREQLSFYHLHPGTGEQVEWPGRVCNGALIDSGDVVRLRPGERYSVTRVIRVFTPEDAADFWFRAKLWGVRDFNGRFPLWEGQAWSNAIRVSVRP